MQDLEKDIEVTILPAFINEKIKSVEWGQWAGPIEETALVRVEVNSKPYVLIEDWEDEQFGIGDPAIWLDEYLDNLSLSEEQQLALGSMPKKALKRVKASSTKSKSEWISSMEGLNGRSIDYMLFEV